MISSEKFEENKGLLWSIIIPKVNKYKSIPGIDAFQLSDELFGEACLAFVKADKTWDNDKDVKYSTWIYTQVDYAVRNFLSRKVYPDASIIKTEISDDCYDEELVVDIIGQDKERIINALYSYAFRKWSFEKNLYLFFVVAFDETLVLNHYFKDFFLRYSEELAIEGYICATDHKENTLGAHKFFCSHLKDNKDNYTSMYNNVKNSMKYFIKKQMELD